jgi:hypothetical protein
MPSYLVQCQKCKHVYVHRASMKQAGKCPQCSHERLPVRAPQKSRNKRRSTAANRKHDAYRALGCCVACGVRLDPKWPHTRCPVHHRKLIEYRRHRDGFKPWRPGGPGRPPAVQEKK